jgi:hypothetical protein
LPGDEDGVFGFPVSAKLAPFIIKEAFLLAVVSPKVF